MKNGKKLAGTFVNIKQKWLNEKVAQLLPKRNFLLLQSENTKYNKGLSASGAGNEAYLVNPFFIAYYNGFNIMVRRNKEVMASPTVLRTFF